MVRKISAVSSISGITLASGKVKGIWKIRDYLSGEVARLSDLVMECGRYVCAWPEEALRDERVACLLRHARNSIDALAKVIRVYAGAGEVLDKDFNKFTAEHYECLDRALFEAKQLCGDLVRLERRTKAK